MSAAVRSFFASCAWRTTTTRRPPKSDGLTAMARSPTVMSPPVCSITDASGSSLLAAATTSAMARATSNSSSPTTSCSGPAGPRVTRPSLHDAAEGGHGPPMTDHGLFPDSVARRLVPDPVRHHADPRPDADDRHVAGAVGAHDARAG